MKMTRRIFKKTFKRILRRCCTIMDRKNQDYATEGNAISNFTKCLSMGVMPSKSVLVRLCDKFARLCELSRKEMEGYKPSVADESLLDTVLDIINYSVIYVLLREEEERLGLGKKGNNG